ncbi:MAG: lactate utilization protein [Eggerthellaceae bacterium]|jgi:L-lactate utilization protein LutB
MDQYTSERNRKLAQHIIRGLASRNMEGYFAETAEEALECALSLIPEGSSISWGGSMSAQEIGLLDAVRNGSYDVVDRDLAKTPEERRALMLQGFDADYFIASTNAITEDGILVNIDGNGNRVACMAYGPRHVILIVGMNKVTKDLDHAMYRARNVAAPTNTQRFPSLKTPCMETGSCHDCKSKDSICASFLITRFQQVAGRIKVILVNENLGF